MLTDSQQRKLFEKLTESIKLERFEPPRDSEREPDFTGRVLLPWLTIWVKGLNHPGLYVRGDGGPSVPPITWQGITIFPDLVIVDGPSKYVALEVKVISDVDPGGSLTKAVGQSVLYAKLGYENSIGMIFDIRRSSKPINQVRVVEELEVSTNTSVFIFR